MNESKKGLIHVKPTWKDYGQGKRRQLGGLVIRPDGQWDEFLPTPEEQDKYTRTMACTDFNTLKAVQALEKQEFGVIQNWSDRLLAYLAGNTPNGNDPNKAAETLRLNGTVYETDWPNTPDLTTWGKFYQRPPYDIVTQAKVKFIGSYDFGHQWVKTDPQSMMIALTKSCLGVDVQAWSQPDENGIYHRNGQSGHWTMIYGYVEGQYWKVLDSYIPFQKKLAWDFGFSMVKEYTLHKQVITNSFFKIGQAKAINWFRAIFGLPPIT